jgi:hypothetical protein
VQGKRHNNFNRPNFLAEYEYEYEYGQLIGRIVAKSNMKRLNISKTNITRFRIKLRQASASPPLSPASPTAEDERHRHRPVAS